MAFASSESPSFLSRVIPAAIMDAFKPAAAVAAAANNASDALSKLPHPYYPLGVEIAGYVANDMSVPVLLVSFGMGVAGVFSVGYLVLKRFRPEALRRSEVLTFEWFVLCGCIHLFFEGYYALNYERMGGLQDLFGQLWKEYSLSDSRYLTRDSFVLCMETITAVLWGPLAFVTAALIALDHPLRHPLQLIVSLGQLYGDVLYYATSMFNDRILGQMPCRPEAYYFWGYFVFLNVFWIVIPFILIVSSCRNVRNAFQALDKMDSTLKRKKGSKKVQ